MGTKGRKNVKKSKQKKEKKEKKKQEKGESKRGEASLIQLIPLLIKPGFSLSLFLHLLCLRHNFNDSEDGLGFSDYDKILHDLAPVLASSSNILLI